MAIARGWEGPGGVGRGKWVISESRCPRDPLRVSLAVASVCGIAGRQGRYPLARSTRLTACFGGDATTTWY